MRKCIIILLLCVVPGVLIYAQNQSNAPSSLQPNLPKKVYAPKVSKKKKGKSVTYDARDKFYDRIEEVERQRRKNERDGSKPQYSNFQYFGHKKPPKRRPPEKMKFCKICGIRH